MKHSYLLGCVLCVFAAACVIYVPRPYEGDRRGDYEYRGTPGAAIRDEVRSVFLLAARRLAEQEMQNKRFDRAIDLGRRLLDLDRYDESAHELVVTALLESGEPGEARRAHQAWADAMDELDIEIPAFSTLQGS